MKKEYLIYAVSILTGISLLISNAFFVSAQSSETPKDNVEELNKEIAERKEKIRQLEQTMNEYKKVIAQKETEAVSLKNQLSILNNRIAQLQVDIELTEEKIAENQLEIDKLNISIDDKKKAVERQKKIISKMVQNIHSSDQKNYVEIMLTYSDFSDFYNELRATENVYVDLGRSVRSLRIAMDDLSSKREQVETRKKNYIKLQNQLETKKGEVQGQEVAKQNLLDQTRSSEARYKTLLSSLKQQYQAIENEQRSFEDKLRKKLEEQNKVLENGKVSMVWPVPSRVVNSLFRDPTYPYKKVFEHSGIDIRASQGTPVKAVASGYVARARRCTLASCYAYVLIVHTGNLSTVYGHLSQINVADDQYINQGDVIGYSGGRPGSVGAGPFVTGPHLHFETRLNGIPVNPLGYVTQ